MSDVQLDKKALKRPDAFTVRVGQLFIALQRNTKALVAIVVGAFIVSISVVGYAELRESKEIKASGAHYSVAKDFDIKVADLKTDDKDWESKISENISKMKAVAEENEGTYASFDAYFRLGNLYLDRGQATKAEEYFQAAHDQASNRMFKSAALNGLSYAQEEQKKHKEAIQTLHLILSLEEAAMEQDARLSLARNYALSGDKIKAMELYDKLVKDFPNSPAAKTAKSQKAALK